MIRILARVIALAIAALLLFALQQTTPGYSEITGPIRQHGIAGTSIVTRSFTLRVEKVVLAERLRWQSFGRSYDRNTGGLWAVALVEAEGTPATMALNGATWLAASGLRFEASQRAEQAPGFLRGKRLEPGLPQRGLLIFEVGRDAARGGTLLVSEARWPRLDTQLRIALPDDRIEQAETLDLDTLK
ncbi:MULTISPECIES: hypothetical protein [Bosea]|uniref:hypothetical protein n=1 Tax=Bosea TaxID=85413 RepID=UPI00214FD540|nr:MULTISPECIES: hypothetical protein [Bosea]MCR4519868.1 hypothetical protein [Bosea sp. 47.2.35]MDR6828886.1 hypothetical protein [Bosea robiniae]MDR6895700.1 hypothetical protein [Bosea sp. BE109]MDR7139096.1 hypothetical protein [Bosea sp. BE168]MDR7175866.1 hypothetical protein [Bosea sp. BE271]